MTLFTSVLAATRLETWLHHKLGTKKLTPKKFTGSTAYFTPREGLATPRSTSPGGGEKEKKFKKNRRKGVSLDSGAIHLNAAPVNAK